MIYVLLDDVPKQTLVLKGELFKYLIKVRRHIEGDIISFRSKENMDMLYKYELISIESRKIELKRISFIAQTVEGIKDFHIGWCLIDAKSIEKVLPSLSEIGVKKISFITCDRSQKNFKIDIKRLQRILEASMQQCGRSSYIEFDFYTNIEEFLQVFPKTKVLDFTTKTLKDYDSLQTVLVGCEGGFSKEEKILLQTQDIFRLNTQMVLRSESAVVAIASKILL